MMQVLLQRPYVAFYSFERCYGLCDDVVLSYGPPILVPRTKPEVPISITIVVYIGGGHPFDSLCFKKMFWKKRAKNIHLLFYLGILKVVLPLQKIRQQKDAPRTWSSTSGSQEVKARMMY